MARTRFTKEAYPLLSLLGKDKCLDDLLVIESPIRQDLYDAIDRVTQQQVKKLPPAPADHKLILENVEVVEEWHKAQGEFLNNKGISVPVVQDALYQELDKHGLFAAQMDSLCMQKQLPSYYIPTVTANLIVGLGEKLISKFSSLMPDLPTENGILLFDSIGSRTFKHMAIAYSLSERGLSGIRLVTLSQKTVQVSSWFHVDFNTTFTVGDTQALALVCLLFIHFFETEKVILTGPAYKTSRTNIQKLNGETYESSINYPVNIIDAHWFTTIVHSDPFLVSGHFRKQPYGSGRAQYKMRWIAAYQKNGYTRKSKHEVTTPA